MKINWKIDDYPACHSKNFSGPNGENKNEMTCCLTSGVHQLHCGIEQKYVDVVIFFLVSAIVISQIKCSSIFKT